MESFPMLYESHDYDEEVFGKHWCGPKAFSYGVWTKVADYPKTGGDGQPAEVLCCATPARFYRVVARAAPNSVGTVNPGFILGTGSGMAELAHDIAKAASEGMLGLKTDDED